MKNSKDRFLVALYFGVTLVRIIIFANQKIDARTWAIDDGLFVKLAMNILHHQWLGPYDNLTLIKGAGYPVFLVLNHWLGLPILLTQHLLYILAAGVLVFLLSKLVKNQWFLFWVYVFILFNPAVFWLNRVVREGIYHTQIILTLAGFFALIVYRNAKISYLVFFSLISGFLLGFTWLTREEGIVLLPSLFFLTSAFLFLRFWERKRYGHLLLAGIPYCVFGLSILMVCGLNKIYYGVFLTNEIKNSPFVDAYGALSNSCPERWDTYFPVPLETMKDLYRVSPSFKELEPYLSASVWIRIGGHPYEIYGCHFVWALRDAVAQAGYHESAMKAAEFYSKLTEEIHSACGQGRISCAHRRATLTPPLLKKDISRIPENFCRAVYDTIAFVRIDGIPPYWDDPEAETGIRKFEWLTHNEAYRFDRKTIVLDGWAYDPDSTVYFREKTIEKMGFEEGYKPALSIQRKPSPDLVSLLNRSNADYARFHIEYSGDRNNTLVFWGENGKVFAELPLNDLPHCNSNIRVYDNAFHSFIDSALERESSFDDPMQQRSARIAMAYQIMTPLFFPIAVILYVISLIRQFKKKISMVFLLNTAILMAVFFRWLLLTYIEVTAFDAFNDTRLLTPAHTLILLFIGLSFLDLLGEKQVEGEYDLNLNHAVS